MNQTYGILGETKPSEFLANALYSFRKKEADPAFETTLFTFHRPSSQRHDVCYLCLAGSDAHDQLNLQLEEAWVPSMLSHNSPHFHRAWALDAVSRGAVGHFLHRLGVTAASPPYLRYYRTAFYDEQREAWHADMDKIVALLQEHGL